MDKENCFVMRSNFSMGLFCGSCGIYLGDLEDDTERIRGHLSVCKGVKGTASEDMSMARPAPEEFYYFIKEGDLGYRLDAVPGVLTFSICKASLPKTRGREGSGSIGWVPVFRAEIPKSTRKMTVLLNETGKDPDTLIRMISRKDIVPILKKDSEKGMIRQVFPVIDIYNLEMFLHLLCTNKKFGTNDIGKELEERLFSQEPSDPEWGASAVNDIEVTPLSASLYGIENGSYILQVILRAPGRGKTVFLFSRGYARCNSESVDLSVLFKGKYRLSGNSMNAVREFDKQYPDFHLVDYIERSDTDNILVPLLAGHFHLGLELAVKSGCTGIAENYDKLRAFSNCPEQCNLKDVYGLPIRILRQLKHDQATDQVLDRLKEIYNYNQAFLQFDRITASMIDFLLKANVTHSRHCRGRKRDNPTLEVSDGETLRILRYLEKHPDLDVSLYCDYIVACKQLGEYIFGLTPERISIREAHDRTAAMIRNNHSRLKRQRFAETVRSEEYLRLMTCFTENDKDYFKEDEYVILGPASIDDIFVESEQMRNCVRIFVPDLLREQSRIYFLRKKSAPEQSFATLEVSGDGERLLQAKGFANQILDRETQGFVRKWCDYKGIRIDTKDISEI